MMISDVAGADVSRETMAKLEDFSLLLAKWTQRINLIARGSVPDIWDRHICDSAQLFGHAPRNARHWVDLGSGGGLPALVCAVLALEHMPECRFTLVESDQRKASFLMTAARELGLTCRIEAARAEHIAPQGADIVSARALAPLRELLPLVQRHLASDGVALLPKGKNHTAELAAARAEWHFDLTVSASRTDPAARLLILKELERV